MPRTPEVFLPYERIVNTTTTTLKYGANEQGTPVLTVTSPTEANPPVVSRSLNGSDELWVSANKDTSVIIRGHRTKPTAVFIASDIASIDAHRAHVSSAGNVDTLQTFFNTRADVTKNVTNTAEAGDGTAIFVGGEVNVVLRGDGSEGKVVAKHGKRHVGDKSGR
jgi:hypothetical protein